jgi:hypothetical protein
MSTRNILGAAMLGTPFAIAAVLGLIYAPLVVGVFVFALAWIASGVYLLSE